MVYNNVTGTSIKEFKLMNHDTVVFSIEPSLLAILDRGDNS